MYERTIRAIFQDRVVPIYNKNRKTFFQYVAVWLVRIYGHIKMWMKKRIYTLSRRSKNGQKPDTV